uniref:Uncharacterized protein n=1 Tax=Setaria viridis TaxID=4556 RepID=A0A4U6T2F0_SETVI|nr:hypothetical protein SEVIR_9G384550v2 [Setaria viridis]
MSVPILFIVLLEWLHASYFRRCSVVNIVYRIFKRKKNGNN